MQKDKKTYHLLVVEDNPGDYMLIEEYLEDFILKPHLIHVDTFAATVKALQEHEHNFDMILLDLSLPDMQGEELISEIIKYSCNIPVIVLTGYSDVNFSIRSLSLGIADYLLKDDLSAVTLYKSIIYNIERKKHLLALQESERRYSDLFHLSPIPMWVFSEPTLYFLDVNRAAIESYGYSKEEFLKMKITEIRKSDQIPKLIEAVESSMGSYESRELGVFEHRKKNKELIQVEIKSTGLVYNGEPARLVLANDITERMQYIDAIEGQNQTLRDIAWTQSHVVRGPVARILGLVEILQEYNHEHLDKDTLKLLALMKQSVSELDVVIKDIVDKTINNEDMNMELLKRQP